MNEPREGLAGRGSHTISQCHGRRRAVFAAALGAATLALSIGVSSAHAVVANVGGHSYGVTPINGVNPLSIPGAYRAPAASGTSRATSPRNFDGPPQGGGLLLNHGGPVMHSVTTHVIYWDPNSEFTPTTKGIFGKFFTDVAQDKELASNVFPIAGQYKDTTGHAAYISTVGTGGTDATTVYPSSGNCTVPSGVTADPGPPYTKCLFDSQLREWLSAYISAHSLPTGPTQQYFVLLPHKVVTCFNETIIEEAEFGPICSNNVFCAYHGSISPNTPSEIIYSDIPFSLLDSGNVKGCQDDGNIAVQHPNGDNLGVDAITKYADVALKYTSHEYTEAATDPLGNAYYDAHGNENGDKCNGVHGPASGIGWDKNAFLPTLGGAAGSGTLFDQLINTDSYYLQSEWDNAAVACLMKPVALSIPEFTASPTSGLVGVPVSFQGAATDLYAGLSFTWKWGDGTESAGATPSHTYGLPGTYEVTMTPRDELTGSTTTPLVHTIVVNDLPSVAFTMSANPTTTGAPVGFSGSANDPDGSIVSYAWSFGDGSAGTGPTPEHAYATPGTYTVTLTITDSGGVTNATSHQITVIAAPVASTTAAAVILPNSAFTALGNAAVNAKTGVITFQLSAGDPGTFSWLLTFQNGKFGVFAAKNTRCKATQVKLKGKCRPSAIVFAKGSQTVAAPGAVTFTVKPTAAAMKALRNALKQKKGLPVTMTLTFQSARGGRPVSHTQSLTVRLKKK